MKPLALVVERDDGTRRLLHVLLSRLGFDTDLVRCGSDALLLLERVDYDLCVTELTIAGRTGVELIEWLSAERPEALARTIVLSSGTPPQLAEVQRRWPIVNAIRKPFELEEISAAAARVVARGAGDGATFSARFARRSITAGAKAGIVLQYDGVDLNAVHSFGYTPAQTAPFLPLNVDAPFPICAAVRTQRPVWLASITHASADYPLLVPVWRQNESRALAAVPLLSDGQVVAAIGWSFRESRLFSEAEQQPFLDIARFVADELTRPDPPHQSSLAGHA